MTKQYSSKDEVSFVTNARRKQIVDATIAALGEIGYIRTSLAQIAKRAGISTALISYHFADRMEVMNHTLITLLEDNASYVSRRISPGRTCREKLHLFIISVLEYQENYPERFVALVEIIFHARTSDDIPYYLLSDGDDEDPLFSMLMNILLQGQKREEFRNFNPGIMAHAIQGALGEYAGPGMAVRYDAASYGRELIELFDRSM